MPVGSEEEALWADSLPGRRSHVHGERGHRRTVTTDIRSVLATLDEREYQVIRRASPLADGQPRTPSPANYFRASSVSGSDRAT